MRTLIIVLIGCVAGLVWLWLGKRLKISQSITLAIFTVAWLGLCGWNMTVGVSHGYGVTEELPFFMANFAVPVLLVFLLRKKINRL